LVIILKPVRSVPQNFDCVTHADQQHATVGVQKCDN
jgi:hypothetical protein